MPQDGISREQKVAAVELGFSLLPRCFQGTWIYIYIGGRRASGEPKGAHEGGGRALDPRGRLLRPLVCTPSLLGRYGSKNNSPEGFILFGLRLIFLLFETQKQGKNINWHWALG